MKKSIDISQFIEQNNLPPFLNPWYLDSVCGEENWDVIYLKEDETIIAVWFYMIKKKLGQQYITMPALAKYMGPYFRLGFDESQLQGSIDQLSLMLPKTNYFFQQWHPVWSERLQQHVKQKHVINNSYLLQILDQKEILNNMDGNYRRSILKYTSKISPTTEKQIGVETIYNSLPSPDMVGIDMATFKNVGQMAQERQQGFLDVYAYQNEVIGACFVLYNKDTAYYMAAGNQIKSGSLYPGVQVVWKTISKLHALEIKKIDFMGSNIASIARIWRKMGAQKIEYPMIETQPDTIFSMLQKIKSLRNLK